MDLAGSQWFLLVLVTFQWFSVVLSGSRRFSVVLVGSRCSRRFSMAFQWFSCWFSSILSVPIGSRGSRRF